MDSRNSPRTPGRPPLSPEAVAARVDDYCRRHGVEPTAEGLPPFPTGQRETPQHRDWLTVYRAVRRLEARRSGLQAPSRRPVQGALACAVCDEPVPPGADAREARLGRARLRLHVACADLAERARQAGPEAVGRVAALLWPGRAASRL